MTKKRVLIFTTGMGHLSLAEAVAESFQAADWEVKVCYQHFSEELVYKPFYLFFPSLFGSWFQWGKNPWARRAAPFFGRFKKREKVIKEIKDFSPHLVVSTYFLYNWVLGEVKKKFKFIFFNLVANPRTFHPLELFSTADLNLVYDEKAKATAGEWGIAKEKLAVVGWPVRKIFFRQKKREKEKGVFTFLLCGGSWGTLAVAKLLSIFPFLSGKTKLILVAGKNKTLFRLFLFFRDGVEKGIIKTKGELEIEVHGFSRKMADLIAASDLVVGKAGPNLLFEAVAQEKPFLAVSHIHGQEDGNLEIIKERNLGWVAEEKEKAAFLIKKAVGGGLQKEELKEAISREKERIKKTGARIVTQGEKAVKTLLTEKSRRR